ncbi:MAG: hypothetical protein ACRDJ1_10720 [Actinomycetota bacterium]
MPLACRCGAPLLDQISREGVTPVGGEPIAFRRTTDFVVCDVCHSVYRISDIQEGRGLDESVLGTQEAGESLVEALERLLDAGEGSAD